MISRSAGATPALRCLSDHDQLARLNPSQRFINPRYERPNDVVIVIRHLDYDYRDRQLSNVLLITQVLVDREEDVELFRGSREQCTV